MAIDNLNFYSAGIPAWQLTDKYSTLPWCLKSKNLDIFSSSKSVKGTAWSNPNQWQADVIKQDGDLILKSDGKVYQLVQGVETLFVDPSINFPEVDVSYNWRNGTYAQAERWNVKDLVVKYEWDEWKSFTVVTDRSNYLYSKVPFVTGKEFKYTWLTPDSPYVDYFAPWEDWYTFTKTNTTDSQVGVDIYLTNTHLAKVPVRIKAVPWPNDTCDISVRYVRLQKKKFYYDPSIDSMTPVAWWAPYLDITWSITDEDWILFNIDTYAEDGFWIKCIFNFTQKQWSSSYKREWYLYIDVNVDDPNIAPHRMSGSQWDYYEYYGLLPFRNDRGLVDLWEYYRMKGDTFQTLYYWQDTRTENSNRFKIQRYDFQQYMWWNNDSAMDVVWMVSWNEQVYMIGNMNWNWYIIPCDLSWSRWSPFIAYGCEFKWVTNIDYLLYLVWEDRGISCLWAYNGQELVQVIGWNKESDNKDVIWVDEQYRFDWKIVNWRKNLILTTTDNRIFQYGQTYGWKWWAFIHKLPENAVITGLKTQWNNLVISYSITSWQTTTNYSITYQDDVSVKNYNTEREATYPIILWNHLLEKEESDLYCSYILPSANTSLEFWGMANHYHFWTFASADNATLSESESYKLKGASGNYTLKFIERNGDQYTFRLEWDLPVQTTNDMKIVNSNNADVITYTDFNHFRKIWEITTDKYVEWEFRFHNLNNKLELPKSYSLQVMVKGKGTAQHTPELFSVDLVANQRERW